MKLFGRELSGYPSTIAILTVVLLVSSGLCGIQSALGINPMTNGIWLTLSLLEFLAFWIAAIGIVLYSIAWLATELFSRSSKPQKDKVQRLFEEDSDTDEHKPR